MAIQDTTPAGPSFPFKSSVSGVLGGKTRKEHITTSIKMILSTPRGSLRYDPDFGSEVPSLVFDIISEASLNLINFYTIQALQKFEKRITVRGVNVSKQGTRALVVWISYVDSADATEQNQEAPVFFTLREVSI